VAGDLAARLRPLITDGGRHRWVLFVLGIGGALLWAYWPVLAVLTTDWRQDPNYSAGQLVPLVVVYLLWRRRDELRRLPPQPAVRWGVAALLGAQAVRMSGLLLLYESIERYSIVLTAAACLLLVAGRRWLWRLRWVVLFALLMVPLPGRVHNRISGPLQTQAAAGAVFLLEISGVAVVREGNTILLGDTTPIAVAEACNGLRMLTAFVMVAATQAFLITRPRWQKAVLVLSSAPVGVACNVLRLFVTAQLYLHTESEVAERFFHDFAGVTMMPVAVLLLTAELWLLARVVVPDDRGRGGDPH